MNIEEIKNKILQLAIEGKLVKQFKEDRPARELLEEIKAEKEKLIKEKVIKKEKALPEISEEEKSLVLHEGWEWCRLGNIGLTNIGLTYKPIDVSNEGVLISTNIQNGKIDYSDLVCINLIFLKIKCVKKVIF